MLPLLPTVNACLNAASAVLLLLGFLAVRRGHLKRHSRFMRAAFVTSTLFLISYLTYHLQVGSKHFSRTGTVRTVYFSILVTHTVLAAIIVPMILTTLGFALSGRFRHHRAL